MTRTRRGAPHPENLSAAPHRFPGALGQLADTMASTARTMSVTCTGPERPNDLAALYNKRFRAALALAKHDPEAAAAVFTALNEELARRS